MRTVSSEEVNPNEPSRGAEPPRSTWLGRRKRIVSREVHSEPAHGQPPSSAVASEMRLAAENALAPADLVESTAAGLVEPTVVDPTAFSVRHRKHSENRTYRLAQVLLALSFMSSGGAIVTFLTGITWWRWGWRPGRARWR